MGNDFEKFFGQIKNVSVPAGLDEQIISKVNHVARRERSVNILLDLSFIPLTISLFWAIRLLIVELSASSFIPLLKLAVSDGSRVLSMFADWGMAIVETLPVYTIALVTGILFVMAVLMDIKIKYLPAANKIKRLLWW